MWKPLLNIDVANTAFYKEQCVIDFMREPQIRPGSISTPDMMKFEKSLKGMTE